MYGLWWLWGGVCRHQECKVIDYETFCCIVTRLKCESIGYLVFSQRHTQPWQAFTFAIFTQFGVYIKTFISDWTYCIIKSLWTTTPSNAWSLNLSFFELFNDQPIYLTPYPLQICFDIILVHPHMSYQGFHKPSYFPSHYFLR